MNIYVYGSNSFKKEISKVLATTSIENKLREIADMDEDFGNIIRVNSVIELKNVIETDLNSIFLIDREKIIKNNIFTQKLKFINPKDGIEEEFLEKHEIAIKVELGDVASIAQYILNRLETYNIDEITQIDEIREPDIVHALENIDEKGI